MRKLIERSEISMVVCDNPECDYTYPYKDGLRLSLFIDIPCPKCGENLLTKEDYFQYQKVIKVVDLVNRWFSWITIFYSKKRLDKAKVMVHFHNGINIKAQ
jgi:hypothetical protein